MPSWFEENCLNRKGFFIAKVTGKFHIRFPALTKDGIQEKNKNKKSESDIPLKSLIQFLPGYITAKNIFISFLKLDQQPIA